MKLYLDTGDLDEIQQALELGVLDGVTTNPTLIAKEKVKFEDRIKEIVGLFRKAGVKDFTVSAEVTELEADKMVAQGLKLAKIDSHVVVKVPLIPEGIKAVKRLSEKNIRTNVTLCFTPGQALLAAKAGAYIISPFVGRLDDIEHRGMQVVEDIRKIYDNYGFTTQVLTASVRGPEHVIDAAKSGSDIATIPYKVFQNLFKHPLTDSGLASFLKDWENCENCHYTKHED